MPMLMSYRRVDLHDAAGHRQRDVARHHAQREREQKPPSLEL